MTIPGLETAMAIATPFVFAQAASPEWVVIRRSSFRERLGSTRNFSNAGVVWPSFHARFFGLATLGENSPPKPKATW